jgi:phosphoenolpyruvate synthase/pyruvate phosphate dikinase
LDDGTVSRLTRAKIAGRRHNFDRFDRKEVTPRAFISCGQSIDLGHEGDAESAIEGELRGTGTSRGLVSGPARVIKSLDDIGRIQQGDILVCQATDPGWTPAFLVIGGLVLETGGLLAHGSCLSREYGLPAVQLPNTMSLIADGSLIEVNGETGIVSLPG